jgi:uncharacterized protein YkwD
MPGVNGRSRARRFALVAIASLLVVVGAACRPPAASAPSSQGGGALLSDIVNRHEGARASAGLPQLAVDPGMNGHAQFHADRLAASAGGSCNIWHSGELGGWYAGHAAGENIACLGPCPSNGGQLMSMWLNSPEHRANIYNGGFRYMGVGAACNGRVLFAVVHFRS